jgi:hypothetical protein
MIALVGGCSPTTDSVASRAGVTASTTDTVAPPPLFAEPPPTPQPRLGDSGDGGSPDGADAAPVTVPAGADAPGDIVAALEAQRAGRPIALYWRHLLLHGTPSDAYLYINDSKTDIDLSVRNRAVDVALAALKLTETWHKGQPRPHLPDFDSVARELTTRKQVATSVDVLAINAAGSTEGDELIDASIVYRPLYADGSSDRTNRLVVVMDPTLAIVNAYFF